MNGADFGTSELIYPENIIINGFHFPYPLNARLALDGDRSTANSALCMRDDSQNNRIYMHDEKDVFDVCS